VRSAVWKLYTGKNAVLTPHDIWQGFRFGHPGEPPPMTPIHPRLTLAEQKTPSRRNWSIHSTYNNRAIRTEDAYHR